jgi:hypothetical protein
MEKTWNFVVNWHTGEVIIYDIGAKKVILQSHFDEIGPIEYFVKYANLGRELALKNELHDSERYVGPANENDKKDL